VNLFPESLELNQLADRAGVSPRTVRYYIQQGLLPAPEKGPGAHYGTEHLDRLLLIKRFQKEHLPLAEIRRLLEESDGSLDSAEQQLSARHNRKSSAEDYIKSVLSPSSHGVSDHGPNVQSAGQRPPPRTTNLKKTIASRSQWDRMPLSADVEVHVRRPLTREQNKQLEQLLAAARQIFTEDEV
jgi:DNA-binding transcriptional MerR regulator